MICLGDSPENMDKIIGFSLTRSNTRLVPPWLPKYPWLVVEHVVIQGWYLTLWGHGDLSKFIEGNRVIAGYSYANLRNIPQVPLQNRGVAIEIDGGTANVRNDALGQLPVVYAAKDGVPYVSTCEEVVIQALGGVTLDKGRLASYLTFSCAIATLTLWKEIDKLYANRVLRVNENGSFEQLAQPSLVFSSVKDRDAIPKMGEVLRTTIRRYTDPLGEIYLPLSAGQDARLILSYIQQRPEHVHTRSYHVSWPAERDVEVVIAKASALKKGIRDHGILHFKKSDAPYTKDCLDYLGSQMCAVQTYLYGASKIMLDGQPQYPVISGVIGDVLAGISTHHVLNWLKQYESPADRFREACYCLACKWQPGDLDSLLTYDWRRALEPIRSIWADIWAATEGKSLTSRSALIRLRNRCSVYITYPWSAIDLWSSIETPYCDRNYVRFMLSLSDQVLMKRSGQRALLAEYHSDIWQYAGVPRSAYSTANQLNSETIRNEPRAFWPLARDGSQPVHSYFKSAIIRQLYQRGIGGDTKAWQLLTSLQSIAWAVNKGYVK